MFKALLIEKQESGQTTQLTELDTSQLPEGDVLVAVEYSTLNYKDGLAITGKAPVVRKFPMVPGIDLAGTVVESNDSRFIAGDSVLLNGWGVGETHWGGLAQMARLNADWLLPLPSAFTPKQTMMIGTAGYTAGLCVNALVQSGVTPEQGEVLVTGASGGVGSIATALLAKMGFEVAASTGKTAEADYLTSLGAKTIVDRNTLSEPGKPLQRERWAGVVDSVGSHTLVNACAQTRYGGSVAACGLAQGADFPATVMPFILRGVKLCGVDSVMAPMAARQHAWQTLSTHLNKAVLDDVCTEITLDQAAATASDLLAGKVKGRVVVDVNN